MGLLVKHLAGLTISACSLLRVQGSVQNVQVVQRANAWTLDLLTDTIGNTIY